MKLYTSVGKRVNERTLIVLKPISVLYLISGRGNASISIDISIFYISWQPVIFCCLFRFIQPPGSFMYISHKGVNRQPFTYNTACSPSMYSTSGLDIGSAMQFQNLVTVDGEIKIGSPEKIGCRNIMGGQGEFNSLVLHISDIFSHCRISAGPWNRAAKQHIPRDTSV